MANLPRCCAVKALYVMGGSAHKGNITPTAEFNFYCDPEAAHLVLKKVSGLLPSFAVAMLYLAVPVGKRLLRCGMYEAVAMTSLGYAQFPQTTLITWDCCMRHATPWIVVDNWFNKASELID